MNIWLNFARAARNTQSSTFIADAYDTFWEIFVVVKDDSDDQYGTDPFLGIQAIGQVESTLRENLTDVDLDGSVDTQQVVDIQHESTRTEDGEPLDMYVLTMEALLSLVNCRQ